MSAEVAKTSNIATREAYGKRLAELGAEETSIVVLDADLSGSTKTSVFAKRFPERFFNVGVAEQNLLGTAAGLALTGRKVFVSTFAIFAAGRAWEITRQSVAYPHLDVKICASHAGITVGEDGASHQIVEDIAIMRVIPGLRVLVPADANETTAMLDWMATDSGPVYLRLGRSAAPEIFGPDYRFTPGKGTILRKGRDIALLTAGYVTKACLDAADLMESEGISSSVISLGSVKPLDGVLVSEAAANHRALFTVEEHSVIGGLGGAVAEALAERHPARLFRLGMQDEFGQSASAESLLRHYRLDAAGIKAQVHERLGH